MWGFILPSSRFFPGRHFVDTELKKIYVKFLEVHKSIFPPISLYNANWQGTCISALCQLIFTSPPLWKYHPGRHVVLPGIVNDRFQSRGNLQDQALNAMVDTKRIFLKNNLWHSKVYAQHNFGAEKILPQLCEGGWQCLSGPAPPRLLRQGLLQKPKKSHWKICPCSGLSLNMHPLWEERQARVKKIMELS